MTGIETEAFQWPADQCEGPCPPLTWPEGGGIVLNFVDRQPLHLVCLGGVMGRPGTPEQAVFAKLYVCGPLEAAQQRTLKLHWTVSNVSASDFNFHVVGAGSASGSLLPAGSKGGCAYQLVSLPFSFGLTDRGPLGQSTGQYREVFRSEEFAGLPEGEAFLKVTVTAADRVEVEKVDSIRC